MEEHCQGIYKNATYLSSFGQVDEATFKKVRIPFSDEGKILHINTLKYKERNENICIYGQIDQKVLALKVTLTFPRSFH